MKAKKIHAPLNTYLSVGFGELSLYCGHEKVFSEPQNAEGSTNLLYFEKMASRYSSDAKWFVFRFTALKTEIFVRQNTNDWTLEYTGLGFADDENSCKDLAVFEEVKNECMSESLRKTHGLPSDNFKYVEAQQ